MTMRDYLMSDVQLLERPGVEVESNTPFLCRRNKPSRGRKRAIELSK